MWVQKDKSLTKEGQLDVDKFIDEVYAGRHEVVLRALEEKPRLIEGQSSVWGSTALHAAAERSELQLVQLLLARGADPNTLDKIGSSPVAVRAVRCRLSVDGV